MGILVGVHPARGFELTGGFAISSLAKPIRANTRNNLLNLHTWALADGRCCCIRLRAVRRSSVLAS